MNTTVRAGPSGPKALDRGAARQLGYTALGPSNVMTLLPAGHEPGVYNIAFPYVVRTAATGTISPTAFFNAPLFGPTSLSSGAGAINAVGVPLASSRVIVSDGTAPITVQYLPTSVVGAPLIDLYPAVSFMSAIH